MKEPEINQRREKQYKDAIQPIYDRAGKACAVKSQKHLREFEESQ
jgi:hypothetical protein